MRYILDNKEITKQEYMVKMSFGCYNAIVNGDTTTLKYNNLNEINELKSNLARTDYQAIKHSEGLISDSDYEPIKAQRQEWRNEINRLENNG